MKYLIKIQRLVYDDRYDENELKQYVQRPHISKVEWLYLEQDKEQLDITIFDLMYNITIHEAYPDVTVFYSI
jgi:hypothetical protein